MKSTRQLPLHRPTPLHIHRSSHLIRKPPLPLPAQAARRPPLIIYTHSPQIIHTDAHNFMQLVQRLTGNPTEPTVLPPKLNQQDHRHHHQSFLEHVSSPEPFSHSSHVTTPRCLTVPSSHLLVTPRPSPNSFLLSRGDAISASSSNLLSSRTLPNRVMPLPSPRFLPSPIGTPDFSSLFSPLMMPSPSALFLESMSDLPIFGWEI